jgi:hypothetical protein
MGRCGFGKAKIPPTPAPSTQHAPNAPEPQLLTKADLVAATAPPDLAALLLMAPDESATKKANDLLVENMKWAMDQDNTEKAWLGQFFEQQPPVLSRERQAVAKKTLSWYQNEFGKSYLS